MATKGNETGNNGHEKNSEEKENHNETISTEINDVDVNIEFQYYCLLLKEIILIITDCEQQQTVLEKIKELSVSNASRDKGVTRNRHLFLLCVSILSNSVNDFLVNPEALFKPFVNASEFSTEYTQKIEENRQHGVEELKSLETECRVHGRHKGGCLSKEDTNPEPKEITRRTKKLFEFFFFLARHYVNLIRDRYDRQVAIRWMMAVLNAFENGCSFVRGNCVDLLQGLVACSYDGELREPYRSFFYPVQSLRQLVPFKDEYREHDPASKATKEFFNRLPDIKEGAFAFVSVSADMFHEIEYIPTAEPQEEN